MNLINYELNRFIQFFKITIPKFEINQWISLIKYNSNWKTIQKKIPKIQN